MSRHIEVVIGTLVLEGVASASRHAIAAAAAAELERLLGHAVPVATDTLQLRAPPVRLASLDPQAMGTGIARALHAALPGVRADKAGG